MTKTRVMIISAAAALVLAACAKAEEKPPEKLPEQFTVNAVIRDGDFEAEAELTRAPEGWQVIMSAPETVEGLRFELTDIESSVGLGELNYPFAAETMPACSPLLLTVKALDGCVRGSDTGIVSGQDYRLTYNDGVPSVLSVGSLTARLGEICCEDKVIVS
ncbi:MAG: hypothetical protein K6B74_11015 [Ruminococcus sp.]|nr:hypothetical protein [Ruminococcus sp.]